MTRAGLMFRLQLEIDNSIGLPFVWGESDCSLRLANIYRDILGVDPAAPYRGRYDSEEGLKAVLGTRGLAGAWAAAAHHLGWQRIKPEQAKTGDIGIMRGGEGQASLMFDGSMWVGWIPFGFAVVKTSVVRLAWSVL